MIQRHLFNAGNVIEYDSDDWRNCPCKNCITLAMLLMLCPYLLLEIVSLLPYFVLFWAWSISFYSFCMFVLVYL